MDCACQAPLSMGFSRQEYWSGLLFPSLGDLPDPGNKPKSPALQADDLSTELWGKPSYDPAISLLGIYPEETKTEKDTCIQIFIAALFTIARTWKQPRWPLTDEWINKLCYIYIIGYYSAIKRNSFESVLMRWMKLEPIILSEVRLKEKHQYNILTHICRI